MHERRARGVSAPCESGSGKSETATAIAARYAWRKTAEGYLAVIEDGVNAAHNRGAAVPPLDAGGLIADYLGRG